MRLVTRASWGFVRPAAKITGGYAGLDLCGRTCVVGEKRLVREVALKCEKRVCVPCYAQSSVTRVDARAYPYKQG